MSDPPNTPPRETPFTIMAKPAGPACNLACEYCFYREKSSLFPTGAATRMSPEVLESFVRQYIGSQPRGEVTFAWQGGEPTLLGLDFFQRVVALQARCAEGRRVKNALQTNGVLIDERWAAFLAEHAFLVGVSIDGPPQLNDRFRRDPAGGPTADRVLRAVEALKRARVDFNTLTVVNRRNAERPLEVYAFLKEIGSTFLQFIPLVERIPRRGAGERAGATAAPGRALAGPPGSEGAEGAAVAPWSVEPARYRDFLCAIFDRWVREDVGRVFVQHFEAVLSAWSGRGSGLCVFDERCGTALVLEHNGDVYSCDHYVYPEFWLGNIIETPLNELARSAAQTAFGEAKRNTLPSQCRECAVRFACNGGCPKHRFVRALEGEPGLNYLCPAYRGFLDHAGPLLQEILRLILDSRSPAPIMDVLRAEDLRRALASAGRNDPCPCGSGRKFKQCCGSSHPAR
ncbi:MAG: anaerobic sulfatase maturase [Spirochaetes bacterium RBG_13_68_11]|nr:MAG: anaerobic sulfatase maturase [Spirochaetes bacterium RBG_13_68_11]